MRKSLVCVLSAFVFMGALNAQAESIRKKFEKIAETAIQGNGDGHSVSRYDRDKFSTADEIMQVSHDLNNDDNECRYKAYSSILAGLRAIGKTWSDTDTAIKIAAMNNKKQIRAIVYSEWDPNTGNSEYCWLASIRVFGVDGSVLFLEYNETD